MNKPSTARSNGTQRPSGPIRYAVIGQGYIAQIAVLPAFAHAKRNSVLAALVSDDPKKLKTLGKRYKVDRLCGYENVDALFGSGEIDAVYIALPNTMHKEYTLRAAQAGLHVLCEKPMAVNAAECEQMIRAAEENQVKLMIAYRLHMEPAYEYAEGLKYEVRKQGRSRKRQFAPELLYFSDCILKNRDPEPSGAEGLADVCIIEALQRSLDTGKSVTLPPLAVEPQRPSSRQEIRRPAVSKPSLVHANPP